MTQTPRERAEALVTEWERLRWTSNGGISINERIAGVEAAITAAEAEARDLALREARLATKPGCGCAKRIRLISRAIPTSAVEIEAMVIALRDVLATTAWEHRCSDGIGGCTAVSASAREEVLADTAVAAEEFRARLRREVLEEVTPALKSMASLWQPWMETAHPTSIATNAPIMVGDIALARRALAEPRPEPAPEGGAG